jgi:hypothetical protein
MADVPESPGQKTKNAVARRIRDHAKRGWPHLGEPIVSFRGQFCYVAAPVPGDSAAAYPASTERVFWNALVT